MLARLIVGLSMLAAAFLGLILTDIDKTGAFRYWQWIAPLFALLALALSWYERRDTAVLRPVTLWHELLHWIGLIAATYLISLYVSWGILGRFEAGLLVLTVLSLAVYLAGIYIEYSFCFIGLILGLFAAGVAFFEEYLYAFSIPVLLLAAAFLFWYLLHHKKNST
jgi:hypothetical protein